MRTSVVGTRAAPARSSGASGGATAARARSAPSWSAAALVAVGALAACSPPATTLGTMGVTGAAETALGWTVIAVSAVVVIVTWLLVLIASLRARTRPLPAEGVLAAGGGGLPWIMIGGIIVPGIVLTLLFIFTALTLRATSGPGRPYGAKVDVIGHQWWWEIHYHGNSPDQDVVTANELHIPVGEPVRVQLSSADVIHSFWVPPLAGKMDVIPGQKNATWIEAKRPGIYFGTCGEYCGVQHANMHLRVVAESPGQFSQWLAEQKAPAQPPTKPDETFGKQVFLGVGCANCHAISGTPAGGALGPDLTHIMSRSTIAAGTLPNTRANRAGWIADAQGLKPGVLMPTMAVKPEQLQALLAYIETLR